MPYYGLAATTHYPGNFLPNKRVGLLLCFLRYLHINNQVSVEVYTWNPKLNTAYKWTQRH